MRVLILHDGIDGDARPDELDTLVQVASVRGALEACGLIAIAAELPRDPAAARSMLAEARPDVVFNLVESVGGEGCRIHEAPLLLEALGLPFTGAGSGAMRRSSSKLLAKAVLQAAGLPTPGWFTLDALRANPDLGARARWIVKSVWEHGSLGLEPSSVIETGDARELARAIGSRLVALGGEAYCERYVHGREFNVALLGGSDGPECLPLPEILFEGVGPNDPRVVGYRAKWDADSAEWNATPRHFAEDPRDAALLERLRDLALATWNAFGLDGWARVDFRVDDGEPWIIDVNANPCLSPDAGFAATLERAGMPYHEAVRRIVAAGLARASAPVESQHVSHTTNR
ncbi:D-alanine--D-alanine ligase family protein [Engelhardtia mirabilis]|uniref:Ddl-like protein n=1 Tax=Engelhardtia mirabilis TaxID=2528011 RepID=A0A518BF78_9BACT|nr:Ddl-like protein [Planctomycetes bacterium Pla133]QDU99965.1 Ddl-like protein [Planctomycetes bacterium Pla86]